MKIITFVSILLLFMMKSSNNLTGLWITYIDVKNRNIVYFDFQFIEFNSNQNMILYNRNLKKIDGAKYEFKNNNVYIYERYYLRNVEIYDNQYLSANLPIHTSFEPEQIDESHNIQLAARRILPTQFEGEALEISNLLTVNKWQPIKDFRSGAPNSPILIKKDIEDFDNPSSFFYRDLKNGHPPIKFKNYQYTYNSIGNVYLLTEWHNGKIMSNLPIISLSENEMIIYNSGINREYTLKSIN